MLQRAKQGGGGQNYSFCPNWPKNRDWSEYDIPFNFPWNIEVETIYIYSETWKGCGCSHCGAYLIPNIYLGNTFPRGLMHAWPQPKKQTPALTQGISNKCLCEWLLDHYCLCIVCIFLLLIVVINMLHLRKWKAKKYFMISRNTVLQFSVIWSFRKNNWHLCARLHLAKVLVTGYNKYHHDIRYGWYLLW